MSRRERWIFPRRVSRAVRDQASRFRRGPSVGEVSYGSFGGTAPISRVFGVDRGVPVDRYYIERFLSANSAFIKGVVLEVGDATYTRRYGAESVERSEILHLSDSENATIVGDLASSGTLPAEAFDCVICTQTLQFIFDLNAAIDSLAAALRPGGVLLATVPGISQVSRYDMERWGDYWRFTNLAIERLFESQFRASDLEIRSHGNVLTALGFLQGLAVSELPPGSFLVEDPDYQVVVTVRAVRA